MLLNAIAPWIDLPYPEQLARRKAKVTHALERLDVEVLDVVPSPRIEGSRARVKLRAGPEGIGFHLPGTHTLMPISVEALGRIARPEVVAGFAALEGMRVEGELEIRSDGERVVYLIERGWMPKDWSVAEHGKKRSGDPRLVIDGLRVSPRSFYQVNLEQNRAVVSAVHAVLMELAPTRILDLYGGIGNLSARAHRRGTGVTLVENEGHASEDAKLNLPGAEILTMDAGRWKVGQGFFDVALLDPPRAGALGLLPRLAVTRPRAIVYLSCDPISLARDLAQLKGYRARPVQPYDMFPGTDHVETLVVLDRV